MDDPRGFVDFQTVLWDVDDWTCTIFMGILILFYDRIVDMEEKWTKSTYQDQSGLCYHDHFDMDSNGKKKNRSRQLEDEHDSQPGCRTVQHIKGCCKI